MVEIADFVPHAPLPDDVVEEYRGLVPDELSHSLHWDVFPEAVAVQGALLHDQSFIFVPLLSMGGEPTVENLHKRQTIEAIQVAVDLQGVIEH